MRVRAGARVTPRTKKRTQLKECEGNREAGGSKTSEKNQAVLEKNTVEWVVSSDRLNAPSAAAGERKTTAMVTKAVT
jgi:hypothetical protein